MPLLVTGLTTPGGGANVAADPMPDRATKNAVIAVRRMTIMLVRQRSRNAPATFPRD
jgi:hypothetical protein